MNTIINVECVDQELIVTNAPTIASGGICENVISFKFCSKWDGFSKTAVFYQNEKNVYYALIDTDNKCEIPHEVTLNEGTLHFGVFGVNGDTRRTSKVDKIRIYKGAWTKDMHPSDPTPDIYTQILAKYNEINENQESFLKSQNQLMNDYQEEWLQTVETTRNEMIAEVEELIEQVELADAKTLNGLTASQVGASGARNLIPYPYVNSTRTVEGIDWTDNGDGTLTANGTVGNTSHSIFNVRVRSGSNDPNPLMLKAGTYTFTGTPKGGSTSTYCTQIGYTLDGAFKAIGYDTGDGFTFTLTEDVQIQIQPLVAKNQTVNNLTFKPMLVRGKVKHDFVPYHFGGAEHALEADNATNADTVDGKHASDFLASTGGKLLGNLEIDGNLTLKKVENGYGTIIKNHSETADYGTELRDISASGKKAYIKAYADGQKAQFQNDSGIYDILHTGNIGQHALLIGGGTLSGSVEIESASNKHFRVKNTTSGRSSALLMNTEYTEVKNINESDASNNFSAISLGKETLTLQEILRLRVTKDGTSVFYPILHTGNSAKVIVSNTPLTAEGSVRVW